MRLNVNGSFDVKKTLTKPFIDIIFFKINLFFVFCAKKGRINVESHMYKVNN